MNHLWIAVAVLSAWSLALAGLVAAGYRWQTVKPRIKGGPR